MRPAARQESTQPAAKLHALAVLECQTHLAEEKVMGASPSAQNSAQYRGCMRCSAGSWLPLSPTTMPPFQTTKAANARGTAASGA